MTNLSFNEEQKIILQLPVLAQKDQPGNEEFPSLAEEKRNKGEVASAFYEDYQHITNPSPEQLSALQYIKENEASILEEFYIFTKAILYPTYIGYIGYDEDFFPLLNSSADLRKTLGLNEIYIWEAQKEGMSYVAFCFDFTGDYEHGVVLIMHKDRIIGFEEDLVNDKVLADLAKQ